MRVFVSMLIGLALALLVWFAVNSLRQSPSARYAQRGQAVAFHQAVRAGDVTKLKSLLQQQPALANARDEIGNTALHWAAHHGQKEIVEVLLAHRADVNDIGAWGQTPLHLAALIGNQDIVALLLTHSANRLAKTADGKTAADLATESGHQEIADLLKASP